MEEIWLQLFPRVVEPFAVLIAAAAVAMLVALVRDSGSDLLTFDQIIAIAASAGSMAAALATYLTVREMRAGRVLSARARLTTPGTDQAFEFLWRRSPRNLAPSPPRARLIIRNASQGVAHNIRVRWSAINPIDASQLLAIQRFLPDNQSISISGGHIAQFRDANAVSSVLAISGEDISHVGDLGPNQETYISIPETMLNSAFLSWLFLLTIVADGGQVDFSQVPLFKMTLTHNSPYQRDIADEHYVRLELSREAFKLRSAKSAQDAIGGGWSSLELTLEFETTSRNMYEIERVVI